MASNIQDTLLERGVKYGEFKCRADITQCLKRVMTGYSTKGITNWNKLSDSQKESLEMIANKIGRILNGDPTYIDSWVDIVGYAQLVVNELTEEERRISNDIGNKVIKP